MTALTLPPVETVDHQTPITDLPEKYSLPMPDGMTRPTRTADVPRSEDCLVVFAGEDGQWYWHLLAAGNRAIIGTGGDGYRRPGRAVEMAERVCRRAAVLARA
jgi:hypothetical protein